MKKNINYYLNSQETILASSSSMQKIIKSIMDKHEFDLKSGIYCEKESQLTNSDIFRFDVNFDNFFKYGDPENIEFYTSGAFQKTYYNRKNNTSFSIIFIANDFGFTEEFKNFIFFHEIGHIKEDVADFKNGNPVNEKEDNITKFKHEFYADEFATISTNYKFILADKTDELKAHETKSHDFYMKYCLKKTDEEISNWNKLHKLAINKEMMYRIKHQNRFVKLSSNAKSLLNK